MANQDESPTMSSTSPDEYNDHQTEAARIRAILQLPATSTTEEILAAIELLQRDKDHVTQAWEALTEMLYLSPDTPSSDVLGNIKAYMREAELLQAQEDRQLAVIKKLQRDKVEILKRFHMQKQKESPSTEKIRSKGRYQGKLDKETVSDQIELDIIDDNTGESLEDMRNGIGANIKTNAINDKTDKVPDKSFWQNLDDSGVNSRIAHLTGNKENNVRHASNTSAKVQEGFELSSESPLINAKDMKSGPHGFILPALDRKQSSKVSANIRTNITQGTRESTDRNKSSHHPTKVAPEVQRENTNLTGSKSLKQPPVPPIRVLNASKALMVNDNAKTITAWTTIEVTRAGGCFEIPDLGIQMTIPGEALPEGKTNETLTLSLQWNKDRLHTYNGDISPIGPILDIKPTGLPFRKPMIIMIPHKTSAITSKPQKGSNLILMQKSDTENLWQPVQPDSPTSRLDPLGFIAPDHLVVHLKSLGKYAFIPTSGVKVIPKLMRIIGFANYVQNTDNQWTINLDIYCMEQNVSVWKLKDILSDNLKEDRPSKLRIFERSLTLSGFYPITIGIEDIMEGWAISGDKSKTFDPSASSVVAPVVTFSFQHVLSQLRCLLAEVVFQQTQGQDDSKSIIEKESLGLCIDLDQLDSFQEAPDRLSTSKPTADFTSTHSLNSTTQSGAPMQPRSATFITDYLDDQTISKSPNNRLENGPQIIKVNVKSTENKISWIPETVKEELAKEIKEEMPGVEKWYRLVDELGMHSFTHILHESQDPILDLLYYCEVTGVSVMKVKDVLQSMGFDDAANLLTKYLKENPLQEV